MSVLTCSRGNCERIMCDRYSPNYGYICADCFEELVSLGNSVEIVTFMNSDVRGEHENTYAKWDKEFTLRD